MFRSEIGISEPPPTTKELRKQELNFSIAARRLPGRSSEARLGGLGDIDSKTKTNKQRIKLKSRALLATSESAGLTNKQCKIRHPHPGCCIDIRDLSQTDRVSAAHTIRRRYLGL